MMKISAEKGYTLVEIIITIAVAAIVIVSVTISIFNFRDNIEYDILLNKVIESTNFAKAKAMASKLDAQELRSSHSVKFFQNRIVDFEGEVYTEGGSSNIVYDVPVGLRLESICYPENNGEVTFSAITGENANYCTIYVYKYEGSTLLGTVVIGKFGVEQAG